MKRIRPRREEPNGEQKIQKKNTEDEENKRWRREQETDDDTDACVRRRRETEEQNEEEAGPSQTKLKRGVWSATLKARVKQRQREWKI